MSFGIGNVAFDGTSLADFGVKMALCKNRYNQPKPKIDAEHVDGRNGDVLFFNGDYENVDITYLCVVDGDFEDNFGAFREWAYSKGGYRRLEDSGTPDEYRMATILEATEVSEHRDCFEVTFNSKPQKYLRIGDNPIEYTKNSIIRNPTKYNALPLIKVTGTGALSIGDETMRITANNSYMMIDCELMDCYRDNLNLNQSVTLTTGSFFSLKPGKNNIVIPSGMSIELTPRWWKV